MRFKIHPAIGIARVGDSPDEFYLAPEQAGQLPNELTPDGGEQPVTKFKDGQGRVKRQAARFRVYGYDDDLKQGKEIQVGEQIQVVYWKTGQTIVGEVKDIQWRSISRTRRRAGTSSSSSTASTATARATLCVTVT